MAHLGSKTSDGKLSFEKYVSKNPKWHSGMKFVVENGVTDAPLVEIKSNRPIETGATVNQGDAVYITSDSYKTIPKGKYCKIHTKSKVNAYLNLRFIRKPTGADVMKAERAAIKELDSVIRKIQVPITIVVNKTGGVGKYEVKDITTAKKIGGTPKADLALHNKYGVPVFWISHKKGGGASAFQQYSGISERSGAMIYQHPECKQFMRNVVEHLEGEHEHEKEMAKATEMVKRLLNEQTKTVEEWEAQNVEDFLKEIGADKDTFGWRSDEEWWEWKKNHPPPKRIVDNKTPVAEILRKKGLYNASRQITNMNQSVYRTFLRNPEFDAGKIIGSTSKLSVPLYSNISDSTLKRMAIYGPDVLSGGKFGQNNIQMIGQGNPVLTPTEGDATFNLSFSSHVSTNEDTAGLGGDYEPVFVATYRAGREFTVDNETYGGARLGIAPFAMVKNRRGLQKV